MKKKFLASLLAVILSISMSVSAFAADLSNPVVETWEAVDEGKQAETENTDEVAKEQELESKTEKETVVEEAEEQNDLTPSVKETSKEQIDITEEVNEWAAEDFTYEEMSERLYGCDYSREFTVSGLAVSGFSEIGLKKLEKNKDLVIPEKSPDGIPIMGVTDEAFKEKGLTSVKFPEGCIVPYDDTVTNVVTERGNFIIGASAFSQNNIAEVILPEGVIAVLTSAFNGNKLEKVTLPKTIWWIENSSFANNNISALNFPKTCTFQCEIHAFAFAKNKIKSIRLPDYTMVVEKKAFLYNPGVESVPTGAPSGEAEMGGVVYMYTDNPKLASMERIHHIDQKSEAQLSWHQKLIVAEKPEVENTWTVDDFIFEGTIVKGLSTSGLMKSQNDKELILPEKTAEGKAVTAVAGTYQAKGTPFTYLEIPSTVSEIGENAFAGCKISKITLPSNLKRIGKGAFRGNELSTLSVPGTVEVISASAFAQEKAVLTELILGEGIREIQEKAFAGSALITAEIPDTLKTLDKNAFKRDASDKIILYTNVKNEYPESDYHRIKLNLGDWNENDFTYEGTVVTGFSDTGRLKSEDNHNLVIPDKNANGDYITEIGGTTASDTDGLFGGERIYFNTVKLPVKLQKIGLGAFRGLGIQKVTFPDTMEEIGMMAFHTNKLKEIILPDNMETLGQAAFATNSTIERIVLGKGLKTISASAFANAGKVSAPYSELIIPNGVTEIGRSAFAGNSIENLEIPNSVKSIGSSAFANGEGFSKLEKLILHEGLEQIDSRAFGYSKLKTVDLPKTVITLHKDTFKGNSEGLVKVYVDQMEQYTKFSALKNSGHTIRIKPSEWTTDDFTYENTVVTGFSEKGLLKSVDKIELTIPDKTPAGEWVTEIGGTTAQDTDGLFGGENILFETLTLPSKVEKIGVGSFRGIKLQKVTFPETLKEIGMMAFHTNELKEIILPDSLTTMGQAAFATNLKVQKIVLSKSLTEIPRTAFGNTVGYAPYTELEIPEGITKIGNNAFNGNSLEKLEIPKTVTEVGSSAFMNTDENQTLKEVVFHEGLTKIGSNAFAYASIKTVDLPSTVNTRKALNANVFKYNAEGNVIVWVNSQEQIDTLSDGLKNPTFELYNKNMFTYEGGSVTGLSDGSVPGEVLVIPRTTPDGEVITEISDAQMGGLFKTESGTGFKEVVLPSGLKRIGRFAFHQNGIEKVNFPKGLEEIAQAAFNSNHLESIVLPDSVEKLGGSVFAANNEISEVILSKNLTEIPERAFQASNGTAGAINFTEIEIPNGVEIIGKYAFGDNHFVRLVLPDSVKEIGSNAFCQTSEAKVLESVKLSGNLEKISSLAFSNSNLSYVTIPETLKELNKNAFTGSQNGVVYLYTGNEKHLEETSKFKPNGVGHKVVLENILNTGWSMEDFTYDGTTVTGWSEQGNITRKKNLNLVIPSVNPKTGETITTIGDSAFRIPEEEWDQGHTGVDSVNGMETVTMPESITEIGDNAFQYNNLETVEFPKGLVSIGGNAFNSNKMKSVSLPDSVTEMKTGAFSSNDITKIKFSDGLTKLDEGVFSNNIHLAHVDIPDTVTEIGNFAFSGDRIESLDIPKSVTKIGRAAFKLHRMTELTIPGNVKEIGESAFEGTYKGITMKKLTLEEGIETIGALAFRMGYLEEVTIPNSVTSMAVNVFKDNTGYKNSHTVRCYTSNPLHMKFETDSCQEFVFRANWTNDCFTYLGTTITGFSQKGVSYLAYTTEVLLPDKSAEGEWITAIAAGAFKGYGLTKVTFPTRLEKIGEEAFLGNNLTEVKLPGTVKDIPENAFDENVKIENQEEKPETPDGTGGENNGQTNDGNGNGTNNGTDNDNITDGNIIEDNKGDKHSAVKTGDEAPIVLFGIVAIVSLAAIVVILVKKRKSH